MPNFIQHYTQGNIEAKSLSSKFQSDWVYLEVPIDGVQRGGGAQPPEIEQETGFLLYSNSQDQQSIGAISFPHGLDLDGLFIPAVKWTKTTSAAGGVAWNFLYKITDPGEVIPAAYTDLGYSIPSEFGHDDTADKFAIDIWERKDIDDTPTDPFLPLGAVINIILARDTVAIGDTYAAQARVMSFGIYCQVDTLGSEDVIIK